MPRYARGAMPDRRMPVRVVVPLFPAAMPATCKPWSDWSGSNGSVEPAYACVPGGNAGATTTLGVVYAVCPFGNPGG